MTGKRPPASRSAREAEAFCADCYRLHAREIIALVYAHVLCRATAEDLTQECFLRLWQHLRTTGELAQPRAWLRQVARNLALDWHRLAERRVARRTPELPEMPHTKATDPVEPLLRQERQDQVRQALAKLEPADRELLTYRYALDYNRDQLAEALEIPASAVPMRLTRARQRLAAWFGPQDPQESQESQEPPATRGEGP